MRHDLNEQCQVDGGQDLSDFSDFDNVNIFNFYGAIYGDIYGFVDGDESNNNGSGDDGEDDPGLEPAVSLTGHTFSNDDD